MTHIDIVFIVKPNPPEKLSLDVIDAHTLKLYYDIPHELTHFPPGLVSSIRYKSEFAVGGEWTQVDTATFPKNNTNFTVLLEDLTPHAMYTVQVRLRSALVSFLTNPNEPLFGKMCIGSHNYMFTGINMHKV